MTSCLSKLLSLLCLFPIVCCASATAEDGSANKVIEIRLRPAAVVKKSDVRLADIAVFLIDGQMKPLRDLPPTTQFQLQRIKVAQLNQNRRAAMVSLASLQPRLNQLGEHARDFRLTGPRAILITKDMTPPPRPAKTQPFQLASSSKEVTPEPEQQSAITDLTIEQSIGDELANQFGLQREDITVTLTRKVIPQNGNPLKSVRNPIVQVSPPAQFPYGRSNVLVRVLDGNRVAQIWNAAIDARVRKQLLVVNRPLQVGMKLSQAMVREEIRFTDSPSDGLTMDDLKGMEVGRPLQAGDVITYAHIRNPGRGPAGVSRPLVDARQSVRVIAKRKRLTVSMPNAEALQSGREGEIIRVRNLRSEQVFSATVVGPGTVEVAL